MILSLDTATTCGWAAGPVGARPPLLQWGSRNFGGTGKTNGEVIGTFRHWLQARCFELKPTIIVFESPYIPRPARNFDPKRQMNPITLRRLLALAATVEAVAWELRIECRETTTSEATKYFTGRGSWGDRERKKAAVIAACRYHGWDVEGSDDAGDALAIWAYAEGIISPRAAEHRRREAADRDREAHGEGPLFPSPDPETSERPAAATARRSKPKPTAEMSLWPETAPI